MRLSPSERVLFAFRRTWPERRARRRAWAVVVAASSLLSAAGGTAATMGREPAPRSRFATAAHVVAPAPTTTSTTIAPPPAQPAPVHVTTPKGLPLGKGMWIWEPDRTEANDVIAIVRRAWFSGLTHLYVRTGSSWMGFYAQDFLNRLLPVAHAAGIRVYGWDFPNLRDWRADADRGLAAVRYTTPDGHRIDGFVSDVETPGEGVRLSPEAALAYGTALREGVGYDYPLIACVPRMLNLAETRYPYPHVVAQFDAIAPMVYWHHRDPAEDVTATIDYLKRFGKPIIPVGQAYDAGAEGGPAGHPSRDEVLRFFAAAEAAGAQSVSFWAWQSASGENWDAIRDAPQFRLPAPFAPVTAEAIPPIRPLLP